MKKNSNKPKKKMTSEQLKNLEKGRKKLAKKIIGNKSKVITKIIERRTIVEKPIIKHEHKTISQINAQLKINFSLFKDFLKFNFFPIEVNNEQKNYNLKEMFNFFLKKISFHSKLIISNRKKIENLEKNIILKDKKIKILKQKIETIDHRLEKLEKNEL